ncbi:MAG: ATP-binding protein [Dehalococcoidia bacterium]|nr:ATP-binding protein [Dehalococcoidia bacterium]
MAEKATGPGQINDMRRRAEEKARENEAATREALSPEAAQRVAQELRVYKIKLEMQNEELRRAQLKLEASRARYFDLYDLAPVGYVTLNDYGLFLEAYLTTSTLLGVTGSAVAMKPLSGFIFREDQDIYYLQRKQVFDTGGPQVRDMRMVRKDGSLLWVRMEAIKALDADGAPVCRAMVSDITVHKEVEVLKDQFLGMVSHEMKTPLTIIIGGLKTVLTVGHKLSEEVRTSLMNDAYLEAESLSDLVQNLLELARVEAGRIVLHNQPVDIGRVLRDMKKKAGEQHPRHLFLIRCSAKVPRVVGDKTRLERVIYNLMDNAAKYSPEGSTVQTSCAVARKELVVGVEDRGGGISLVDQSRLFVPFERLGKDGPEFVGGTGLGLVVCKRLIEAHGGRIWVESQPGKGSTFFFALPLGRNGPPPT